MIFMVTSTYNTLPSSNIIGLFTFNSKAHGVMILHDKPKLATHHHVVQYLQDDHIEQVLTKVVMVWDMHIELSIHL
jgi:hypothetical protein